MATEYDLNILRITKSPIVINYDTSIIYTTNPITIYMNIL